MPIVSRRQQQQMRRARDSSAPGRMPWSYPDPSTWSPQSGPRDALDLVLVEDVPAPWHERDDGPCGLCVGITPGEKIASLRLSSLSRLLAAFPAWRCLNRRRRSGQQQLRGAACRTQPARVGHVEFGQRARGAIRKRTRAPRKRRPLTWSELRSASAAAGLRGVRVEADGPRPVVASGPLIIAAARSGRLVTSKFQAAASVRVVEPEADVDRVDRVHGRTRRHQRSDPPGSY